MSVIKHKEQRVGVFIDTQNIYHSAKNPYHSKVNFGQIVKDAVVQILRYEFIVGKVEPVKCGGCDVSP
jgi:hypothetical protein